VLPGSCGFKVFLIVRRIGFGPDAHVTLDVTPRGDATHAAAHQVTPVRHAPAHADASSVPFDGWYAQTSLTFAGSIIH